MSDRSSSGDKLAYLLIGAGIGATLALLFAPKSGRELRRDIAGVTRKTYHKGEELAHSVGDKVSEGLGRVRETAEKEKGKIAAAIEAGKQAYREERQRGDS
ncbi:MAG: YtxH domain-containing protein [Candidatus Eisenbacteria bacterium]|nr:YtxH domain-containing protein [Candidatus Eisenbacteria bacterium]